MTSASKSPSPKQRAAWAKRKGARFPAARTDHVGQTYGYARVERMLGDYAGTQATEYAIWRRCCDTAGRMSHADLNKLKSERSQRCQQCARDHSPLPPINAAEGSSVHAVANALEVRGLIEQRARDAADMLARVADRRAQAEAKLLEAHARATGHRLSGRPDFSAPLPLPTVEPVRHARRGRRHG